MYQGYPDFQQSFVWDNTQWIAAYQSEGCYFRYPKMYAKLAENPLNFSLNVIRSNTSKTIYGTLDFQAILEYIPTNQLTEFHQQHPKAEILALPVTPYKLGFSGPMEYPSELTQTQYNASWFSAQSIQFTLLLNSDTTQLVEKTLLNDIVGFNARIDGFIEGVSPRLDYQVTCDPKVLLDNLGNSVEGAKLSGQSIIFSYSDLLDYFTTHLITLCPEITPKPPLQDPTTHRLISQTIIDRLYNRFGGPACGSPSTNFTYVELTPPTGNGRLILELDQVTLTQRPIAILLDPFTAAQQIAKVSPDQIIHNTTAPAIPGSKVTIDVIYPLPPGLVEGVNIDIQLELPSGKLYPIAQQKTQAFEGTSTQSRFVFNNNDTSPLVAFTYQLRVSYQTESGYKNILGEKQQYQGNVLVLDYNDYPCDFFTLEIDSCFAKSSNIEGHFETGELTIPFTLSRAKSYFNYPILGNESKAFITAHTLNNTEAITLQRPILKSTQIGAYSFPEFGHHQATIEIIFEGEVTLETVQFQSESTGEISQHVFTLTQPRFDYQWNVTSIYQPGFRYQYGNSPWSSYVTDDQTIHLETTQ